MGTAFGILYDRSVCSILAPCIHRLLFYPTSTSENTSVDCNGRRSSPAPVCSDSSPTPRPRLPSPRFPVPPPPLPPPGYPSCWNPHLSTLTGFPGFFDVGAETQLLGRALPRCQGPVTVCGCEWIRPTHSHTRGCEWIRRTRSHARCITQRAQGSPPFCCRRAGSCMCKGELCPQASHVRTRFRSCALCGGGPHQVPGLELKAPE